jgi:LSD1 subclass zinc finger protein
MDRDDDDSNVKYLDFYRRDWSAGIIYCHHCDEWEPHMWITGASVVRCPMCDQLIDLVVQ